MLKIIKNNLVNIILYSWVFIKFEKS